MLDYYYTTYRYYGVLIKCFPFVFSPPPPLSSSSSSIAPPRIKRAPGMGTGTTEGENIVIFWRPSSSSSSTTYYIVLLPQRESKPHPPHTHGKTARHTKRACRLHISQLSTFDLGTSQRSGNQKFHFTTITDHSFHALKL